MAVYAVSRESKRIFAFHKGRLETIQRICTQHNARRPNAAFLPLYNYQVSEREDKVAAIRYVNRVANEFKRTMFMCTDLEAVTLSDLAEIADVYYYRVAGDDLLRAEKAEEGQTNFRSDPKGRQLGVCLCVYTGKWAMGELIDLGPKLTEFREGKRMGFNKYARHKAYKEELRRKYRGAYGGFAEWQDV